MAAKSKIAITRPQIFDTRLLSTKSIWLFSVFTVSVSPLITVIPVGVSPVAFSARLRALAGLVSVVCPISCALSLPLGVCKIEKIDIVKGS